MWFEKRHKRHKIRKPSNHAGLSRGVFKIKNATRFFLPCFFCIFWISYSEKKITERNP